MTDQPPEAQHQHVPCPYTSGCLADGGTNGHLCHKPDCGKERHDPIHFELPPIELPPEARIGGLTREEWERSLSLPIRPLRRDLLDAAFSAAEYKAERDALKAERDKLAAKLGDWATARAMTEILGSGGSYVELEQEHAAALKERDVLKAENEKLHRKLLEIDHDLGVALERGGWRVNTADIRALLRSLGGSNNDF